VLLVIGFFIYDNLQATKYAKQYGIPVVLNPVAQVTDKVLEGKIFTQDPDVRKLEQTGLQLPAFKQKLLTQANPFIKQIFLNSVGRILAKRSDQIAVFSQFEMEQFQKHLAFPTEGFVLLRWGVDQVPEEAERRHYFRDILGHSDNKANYVYWGRLDWHYKGLDRLLNGILKSVRDADSAGVPFRLFLIGPDYNGGAGKIQQFIQMHQLEEVVHLMLPGSYPAGSKIPLRDASASIYLSRWDGFPRTLRESIVLGVPVLVSKETHFGDLIPAFESGIVLKNPDDSSEVAEALMLLAKPEQQQKFKQGAARLSPELSWQTVTQTFIEKAFVASIPERRALK
jgi:glycosyltransferase involved in cell wall biosynthesis